MTDATVVPRDEDLLDLDPPSERYVDPALIDARRRFRAAVARLASIPDDRLEALWAWRAGEPNAENGEVELRYAFYRVLETLQAGAGDFEPSGDPSARWLAAATEARWALHGALAALDDATFDRDPGGGEWTVRQTVAHLLNSQRAYGWFTAWWISQRGNDDPGLQIPPEVEAPFPDDSMEATGTLDDVRRKIDGLVDVSAARYSGFDEGALGARARWSGYPVEARFRLGRWSSHMREHTIQVDKTLAMLGDEPREVVRLVRLLHDAWGRFEGRAFGRGAALTPEDRAALGHTIAVIEATIAELPAQ